MTIRRKKTATAGDDDGGLGRQAPHLRIPGYIWMMMVTELPIQFSYYNDSPRRQTTTMAQKARKTTYSERIAEEDDE